MIYEQPLNEHSRLCLRLEYLLILLDQYTKLAPDDHQAVKVILEILQVIDRHDLKNKFLQNLIQYQQTLSSFNQATNIDQQKLAIVLKQLNQLINELHTNQKKIGKELRENEFLSAIQQRLYTPAGTCGFSMPAYQLWLRQNSSYRKTQLLEWVSHLSIVRDIVNTSLKLIRESNLLKTAVTKSGFYQCNLDPNTSYQMIRIELPHDLNIFPEISVGRYRVTIHFFNFDIGGNHKQRTEELEFKLSCCKL